MTTMNVSLTPELVKIVQAKVKSGLYSNASEVIRDAIRTMGQYDEMLYEAKLDKLKKALEPGLREAEAGIYADFSLEKVKKRLDAKRKNKSGSGK